MAPEAMLIEQGSCLRAYTVMLYPQSFCQLPKLPYLGKYLLWPSTAYPGCLGAVVIPARNEKQRIVAALEGVRCQWSLSGQSLQGQILTIVLVNGSCDGTATEVIQWQRNFPNMPVVLVDINFPDDLAHVGSARGLGMQLAADLLAQCGRAPGMIFSTDADSKFSPQTFARAAAILGNGADAVGAFIRAGETDTSSIGLIMNQYQHFKALLRQTYYPQHLTSEAPHGNFGGAGFALSLQAFQLVNGLPLLAYDEDVAMRRRLLDAGCTIAYPQSVIVYTSTRQDGRTPWGMAKQLAAWEDDFAAHRWPTMPSARALRWKYEAKSCLANGQKLSKNLDPGGMATCLWDSLYQPQTPFESNWSRFWGHLKLKSPKLWQKQMLPLPEALASLQNWQSALRSQPQSGSPTPTLTASSAYTTSSNRSSL